MVIILLKLILLWPIFIIKGIILLPIFLITTIFLKKGRLAEFARRREILNIARLIHQGYDVNEQNTFGQTPLHGVFFDTIEDSIKPSMAIKTLEYLINSGADVNIADKRNWSPLLYAIGADYTNESIYLINTKNILLNKKFYNGNTALHYAVIKNNIKIVKHLLEKGIDPNIRNSDGLRAVDCSKSIEINNLLLDKCS